MLSRLFARLSCRSSTIADAAIPPVPAGVVFVPPPPPFNELTDPSTLVLTYKRSRPHIELRLDGVMTPDNTIEVVFDTNSFMSIVYMNETMYPSPASMRPYLSPHVNGRGIARDTATIRLGAFEGSSSSLAFPLAVKLANGPSPAMLGELGAMRMSDFTLAAGLFAYSVDPDSGESATLSVRVPTYKVIEELHCQAGLSWMPLSSTAAWTVSGKMRVGDTTPAEPFIFAVDTANPVLSLQPGMFDTVMRLIRSTGAIVARDGNWWTVYRCSEHLSQFPHIYISLGEGFTAILGPNEYTGRVRIESNSCYLNIIKSSTPMIHLGSPFLRRTTVVFDNAHNQLGMCRTASGGLLTTTTIPDVTTPPAVGGAAVDEELLPLPSSTFDEVANLVEMDGAINPDLENMYVHMDVTRSLPRVQLKLAGMNTTGRRTVEVLLDTGSPDSLIIMDDIMYPSPPVTGPLPDLMFGVIDRPMRFRIRGIANDTASLRFIGGSPFEFPVQIQLTETADPNLGFGILGAGPMSDFTRSAGLFAYSVDTYGGQSATLLVRVPREDLIVEYQCRSPLAWTPLLSTTSWTVAGTTEIVGSEMAVSVPTRFTIDTGASGLFLWKEMYDEVVSSIEATGATVSPAQGRVRGQVSRCSELSSQFPSISISVGEGFTATLGPYDYLGPARSDDTCSLNITTWSKSTILLGSTFLRWTTVAFDQEHNRLGMCRSQ